MWWLLLPTLALAQPAPEQLLVRLQRGVTPQDVGGTDWRPLVRSVRHKNPDAFARSGLGRVWVVPETDAARWAATPGVELVEPDHWGSQSGVPNDPGFPSQWGLSNDGSWSKTAVAGADINAPDAWDIEDGDPTVVVAVLDSGFVLEETDVRFWSNPAEVPGNGVDDDNNGYADDVLGWDFVEDDSNPRDATGHGTNVAAIAVAAGNNNVGLSGVCPRCSLMVARNLGDDGFGQYSWWAESLVYAVDNGASVVNMSEGGTGFSDVLRDAANYAFESGVPVVAAMMNTDSDTPYYPAAVGAAMGIGATNDADDRASPFSWGGGSNWGSHIEVVAPGNSIAGFGLEAGTYDSFWSGTSQATPHVAGLIGLMLARDPTLLPAEIRSILRDTAVDEVGSPAEDTEGFDEFFGHGRIDAAAALGAVDAQDPDQDGDGYAVADGDCNDLDATIFPGAEDLADDNIDQDCDGIDPTWCFVDADGDGWGSAESALGLDGTCDGDGLTDVADDCDDGDAAISPDGVEDCDDGVDQDCDGDDEICDVGGPVRGGRGCTGCGDNGGAGTFALLLVVGGLLGPRRRPARR
jgi:uncharacterized protein (TIGR03382 family)